MTAKEELGVLALLLTLSAMLYLAVWFIEGPPGSREAPAIALIGAVASPGPSVLNHRLH